MSRRSTPERIDGVRRAATRSRLVGEGVTEETADAWIAAWARQAGHDAIDRGKAYWDARWIWIAEQQRKTRRTP